MKKITIILPIHKIDSDYKEMLSNAISSIEDFHNDVILSIVCPSKLKEELKNLSDMLEIKFIDNDGNTDFCSQINLGIEKCETEWFSIFEIDDEYRPIWLKSMNEYLNIYSDVDVFLPIIRDLGQE